MNKIITKIWMRYIKNLMKYIIIFIVIIVVPFVTFYCIKNLIVFFDKAGDNMK